jgi:translation initiation factor 3 subunit H
MAAALAASLPAPVLPQAEAQPQVTKVPQRLEGVVDPDALRDVESVSLNALVRVSIGEHSIICRKHIYRLDANPQVFLKMMKHSTDTLPSPPQAAYTDRAAPPTTNLSSHVDALGVLVGLDLDGVLEVEDSFALPVSETALGGE